MSSFQDGLKREDCVSLAAPIMMSAVSQDVQISV
jgi:hypothetical protein